eukprot:superscaffoldBa00001960_g12665
MLDVDIGSWISCHGGGTGSPQGCVLSPLLFTLLTHDCFAEFNNNYVIKFADDTAVVGVISNGDESAYGGQVEQLTAWCKTRSLAVNTDKTEEMIIDFRKGNPNHHPPLTISGSVVERVNSTKFLGLHLTDDMTSSHNTTAVIKKARPPPPP